MARGMHVYGLTVTPDLETTAGLTGSRRLDWPSLYVAREVAPAPTATGLWWDDDHVRLDAATELSVSVRPHEGRATISAPHGVSDEAIVHPLLAFAAAVMARAAGRTGLHAAATVLDGRAWVLLGGPGSGKSTLASELGSRGHVVQTDDLAVIDGYTVFGGPRSCDLRPDAAEQLGRGRSITRHLEQRFRDDLPPAPYEAPLGGFVDLRWGEDLSCVRAGVRTKLDALASSEAFNRGPSEPTSFLRLLDVPMLLLTRPRAWDLLPDVIDLLEQSTVGATPR